MKAKVGLLGMVVVLAALASGCIYQPPSPYHRSQLSDVATISKSDVWAVGATDVWAVGGGRTLHWDGRAWSVTVDPSGLTARKVEAGR